jgi:hypothetical protein
MTGNAGIKLRVSGLRRGDEGDEVATEFTGALQCKAALA